MLSAAIVLASEAGGPNHWAIGAATLLIFLVLLGALVAFGGGREHS